MRPGWGVFRSVRIAIAFGFKTIECSRRGFGGLVDWLRYAAMSFYRRVLRPILFKFDPERCHGASIGALEMAGRIPLACSMLAMGRNFSDSRLATEVCGMKLSNPI